MPENYNTLAGLIQFNDRNLADTMINDLLDDAPLLSVLHAQVASNGTQHKYLKQTGPSSAAYRNALAGAVKTNSEDTLVTDTLQILDASFDTDVAIARGYNGGVDAWLEKELARSMRQSMAVAEKQVIYGTGNDAGGFTGLVDDDQLNALGDEMVTDGGGVNAATQTSVFLLRHMEDSVSFLLGNDGQVIVSDEANIVEKIVGPGSYPAYYVPVIGWHGLQIGGARSAARIANVETNVPGSDTALTDDKIYESLSLFPASRQPNAIVMNRVALRLLRQSRTAHNQTGAPAPRPTEVEGIPIIVTDSIVSDEAVVV